MAIPPCNVVCGDQPSAPPTSAAFSAAKISNTAPFAAPAVLTTVPFDNIIFNPGTAISPDLAGDALVVNEHGFYEVIATQTWSDSGSQETIAIAVNGDVVQLDSAENPAVRAGSLSVLLELDAGDVVQLQASSDPTGGLLTATLSVDKRG